MRNRNAEGKFLKEDTTKKLRTMRLSDEAWEGLRIDAEKSNRSRSEVIELLGRYAYREWLER